MPNIKSAKKRVVVNEKKNAENRAIKSQINTAYRKFMASVEAKNAEQANLEYRELVSILHSAVSKGVIHKNTASRRESRLAKLLKF